MRKLLYVATASSVTACSSGNNLPDALYQIAESSAAMVLESLQHTANKELVRHTGIDSLAQPTLSFHVRRFNLKA